VNRRSGFSFFGRGAPSRAPAEGTEAETPGPSLLRNLFYRQRLCQPHKPAQKDFEQMPELVYLIKRGEKDFAVRLGLA
jgi:hypothetical protein